MALESRARSNQQVQQQRRQRPTTDTHDEEEFQEESVSLPYRKAYDMAEKFATTRIGQFFIVRGDRLLKIIETTAKWSLPQDQMKDKLQRPLPWIPFLMIIIALRLTRIWVSIGAMMIGNAPIKAQDMVYFIQTRRRKLRALRLRGIKEICRRETENKTRKPGYGQNTLMAQMKRFFSIAICRPGQHREPERRMMIHRGKEIICDYSEHQVAKRPRADDCEADMTFDELLNKYANDNTEDDSDFVPNQDEDNTDDNSATSSETNESTDEGEVDIKGTSSATKQSMEHKSEKRRNRYSKDSDTSLNQSVEFKENGNGEMMTIPKPIVDIKPEKTSDTEQSEMSKTPHENGPSNGSENREVDVAFKFVLTPPGVENDNEKHFTPVMDVKNSYKSTPGHMSAAKMKLPLSSVINATGTAVPEIIQSIDLTSIDTSSDAVDTTTRDTDNEVTFEISSPDSSPTLSAASSSTSIDSFTDTENVESDMCAKTTETTASMPINKANDLDSAAISSVSSSEDDFYSPIGSPQDFNTYQEGKINFKFNNTPRTHPQFKMNTLQKTISEPHISEIPVVNTSCQHNHSAPSGRRNQYQSHQGNSQNRYRGRNRR